MTTFKNVLAILIGVVVTVIMIWCFESRERNGPRNLVEKKGDGGIQIVTAAGDTYTVSSIKFVDKDGNTVAAIHAGPPPTIEITDDKGKIKTINLRKLAENARWFGEGE